MQLTLSTRCISRQAVPNQYLLVKRKSSKAFASSGHMLSNFPDEEC